MAPGLKAVYVYEGGSDVSILNQMAVDNVAKQLSYSFGWLPADPASDEPIFKEFAAQGQNLFVASGDSGAFSASNPEFYPGDEPLVTAVGGTDITTTGPGGAWVAETAWVGSSGGVSTNGFAIPSYQAPYINSSNGGSTCVTFRTWRRKPIPTTISAPTAAASAASVEPASRHLVGPASWRWRINRTAVRPSAS
jgi:hypothetical protein